MGAQRDSAARRVRRADAGPVLLVLVAPAILSITETERAPPARRRHARGAAVPRRALVPERASAAAGRALARLASVPLRRLVFGRGFWERGLAMAWHAPRGRDDFERMARDYALPSRVRGWEDGMLRFVLARGREGIAAGSARLVSLARERIQQRRLRVLIVQGARDRILPPANALALRNAFGGDTALVCGAEATIVAGDDSLHFGDCGHVPHEEQPERFVRAVSAWAAAGGGGRVVHVPGRPRPIMRALCVAPSRAAAGMATHTGGRDPPRFRNSRAQLPVADASGPSHFTRTRRPGSPRLRAHAARGSPARAS